jgi:hypothetical protein
VAESIFYVVEIALPDKDLPKFAEWYAAVHAPHLFQAGFTNCTSYLATSGGLSVVDIYQAADWSMFEAPAFARYRRIVFTEPYRPCRAGRRSRTPAPSTCHHASTPLPSRDPDAPLDADWVTIWRFGGMMRVWRKQDRGMAGDIGRRDATLGVTQSRLLHRGQGCTHRHIHPPSAGAGRWNGPERPPEDAALLDVLPEWLKPFIDPAQGFARAAASTLGRTIRPCRRRSRARSPAGR